MAPAVTQTIASPTPAASTPYYSRGYEDPSTYYMTPDSVANNSLLSLLNGGNDPFAGMSAQDRAYVQGLEQYTNSLSPMNNGYYTPGLSAVTNMDEIVRQMQATNDPVAHMGYLSQLQYASPDYASAAAAAGTPYDDMTRYTQSITGSADTLAGSPTVWNSTPIQLVNNKTGDVAYSGSGFSGLQQAALAAQGISGADGSKANWSLQTAAPGTTNWNQVANDAPDKSGLGIMADLALPALMLAIPGVGTLAGSALLAAGGSGLSSALQGRSLGDAAKMAALTGGAVFGGGSLLGAAGAGGASAAGAGGVGSLGSAGAIGTPLTSAQIAGLTSGIAAPSVGGAAAGSALGGLGGLGGVGSDIVVTAGIPSAGGLSTGAIGGTLGSGALGGALSGAGSPATPQPTSPSQQVTQGSDIVVNGQVPRPPVFGTGALGGLAGAGAIGSALGSSGVAAGTSGVTAPNATAPQSTLDKILDYIQLAQYGSSTLGSLFGGGANAGGLGGVGSLNPIFGAQLPTSNLPDMSPRSQPTDWNRYAFGPERSFFNNVPVRQYAKGGDVSHADEPSFAVSGPGTGRSDDIQALLSDGEYVMDAETVALLGDGSNKAGADKLDAFRVNIRKHKGRELARGGISRDAKQPDAYLPKGSK